MISVVTVHGLWMRGNAMAVLQSRLAPRGFELHAFAFLSNHFHLLLTVSDSQRLASFMNYLNSNLAREAGIALNSKPFGDCPCLFLFGVKLANRRWRTVEYGNGIASIFAIAIRVCECRTKETIGLHADLMRRAIVYP